MDETEHGLQQEAENELTAETFEAFRTALKILYIKNNRNGRINFVREWPAAATYVLGDVLITQDMEGQPDRDTRTILEDEALERQLDLLEITKTLKEHSVNQGSLKPDYVESLVMKFGRDLALHLYAQKIVDRFIPPPASEAPQDEDENALQADVAPPDQAVRQHPPVLGAETNPLPDPPAPSEQSAPPSQDPPAEPELTPECAPEDVAPEETAFVQPLAVTGQVVIKKPAPHPHENDAPRHESGSEPMQANDQQPQKDDRAGLMRDGNGEQNTGEQRR